MSTVIKIENLSKRYRLGLVGTNTLHGDLKHWWAKLRGREEELYKIGEENKLSDASGEYVWALRDINLEVQQGEVLGIIGKNGAGKSTLLKLLSRVTGPTTGNIKVKGRIASLLEVGTGFHPELTGRENIYLNGAILGMRRHEINRKFDEIVEFAGVAKYIDTPVKRYSSGMYVRLAFAVAAHLEPEILIVDEVLAVGDAEFQKKAIGKMQDVSTNEGRTVLFVSHNMASVRKLCTSAIMLKNGRIDSQGKTDFIVKKYIKDGTKLGQSTLELPIEENTIGTGLLLEFFNENKELTFRFLLHEEIRIRVTFELYKKTENVIAAIGITTAENISVTTNWSKPKTLNSGKYYVDLFFKFPLARNFYFITIGLSTYERTFYYHENIAQFEVTSASKIKQPVRSGNAILITKQQSEIQKIDV